MNLLGLHWDTDAEQIIGQEMHVHTVKGEGGPYIIPLSHQGKMHLGIYILKAENLNREQG